MSKIWRVSDRNYCQFDCAFSQLPEHLEIKYYWFYLFKIWMRSGQTIVRVSFNFWIPAGITKSAGRLTITSWETLIIIMTKRRPERSYMNPILYWSWKIPSVLSQVANPLCSSGPKYTKENLRNTKKIVGLSCAELR